MAPAPRIVLACSLLVLSIGRASTGEHRSEFAGRGGLALPLWFHEKLARTRHDGRDVVDDRSRDDLTVGSSTTVAPHVPGLARRHVDQQRVHEQRASRSEKFSAVAVAEYSGTRAIAYAGFHNNHRHQPSDAATQSYHHHTTTPATYTRHHPG
ncbi:uncharacterized protein LOC108624132 [Ceratina calcarata]|uniref:Uncharacterized protein LOC108624132 n=1 Tax=Ceratina calcarata TaxID=156304 RepID=A0AAJ7IX49_9HYME|nr:uncharacterized protein LOC108624132 [Ceratina calcarata]